MITIDGAQMSGSGTIVRYAVALAALLGQPIRTINARRKRREPGLRPQHVTSVRACAELCGATVEGVEVGSRTFDFVPGSDIAGGCFEWDIGTAGSATMLALKRAAGGLLCHQARTGPTHWWTISGLRPVAVSHAPCAVVGTPGP